MKNQRGDTEMWMYGITIGIVVLFFLGLFVLSLVKSYGTQRYETIIVNKSERVVEGRSSRYLIYTQQGVYENVDSFLLSKFNSSDLYNQLQAGKTYSCLVTGWRNGFFSWYPNLIRCQ